MNHDHVHDTEGIRTFSGTHAWDPSVLVDTDANANEQGNADDIVWDIEHGLCPRCEGPLPTMPGFPAGSRITACRSIPICGRCGLDEVFELLDSSRRYGATHPDLVSRSPAGAWPIPVEDIEERRARHLQQMTPAILDLANGTSITKDGVAPLINPCNTGGWAQYGFGDEGVQWTR